MSQFSAQELFKILQKDLSVARGTFSIGDSFPTLDQRDFAIDVMRDKFLSKFVPRAEEALDRVAFETFAKANESAKAWRPAPLQNSGQEQLVGTFLNYLDRFFLNDLGPDCDWSWGNISLHARSGPGVCNGGRGTSFFEKHYSSPITASSPFVLDLYQADIRLWPEECIAEQIRDAHYGPPKLIGGSKLSFVPKTTKTSRMIAIEPTLNMFYQLGIGAILEKRLRRFFGIDLSTQPDVNRCLARLGSVIDASRGDGFATIDLSSASDSISLGLCGYSIPAEALDRMLSVRCSYASSKYCSDATGYMRLNMLSTMGNGYTFPIQTAIFAAVAAASVSMDDDILDMPKAWSENHIGGLYSVFGDDIIVRSKAAERTLWLLRYLGFTPNTEKCFVSGSFRESCGFDFYQGFNVRPFFLRKADTIQDLSVCYNGLVEWAARCLVPINGALDYVCGWINSLGGTHWVPLAEDAAAGVRVPFVLLKGFKKDPWVQSVRYSHFVAKPGRLRFRDGGKPIAKYLISNPSGLFMSILRGECRSGVISQRSPKTKYGTKVSICPNWDHRHYSLQEWFDDYSKSFASFPRRAALIIGDKLPNRRRRSAGI